MCLQVNLAYKRVTEKFSKSKRVIRFFFKANRGDELVKNACAISAVLEMYNVNYYKLCIYKDEKIFKT